MSDAELQQALRDAASEATGPAWLRAAKGLARAARRDEAAHALVRARALGGAPPLEIEATQDALLPPVLGKPRVQELGGSAGLGRLASPAWSADGRTVLAIEDGRAVVALDVATGEARRVASFRATVTAFAPDETCERLAVALGNLLTTVDFATGTAAGPVGQARSPVITVTLAAGLVHVLEGGAASTYRLADGALVRRVASARLGLDRSGALASLGPAEAGTVVLHDPAGEAPRATAPLGAAESDLSRRRLAAAGLRAVLTHASFGPNEFATAIFDADGRELARVRTPLTPWSSRDGIPSPSGWLVASCLRRAGEPSLPTPAEVVLLDLRHGARVTRLERGTFEAPAWSPSGRRLALGSERRTSLLAVDLGE